jgi:hypothetical protein
MIKLFKVTGKIFWIVEANLIGNLRNGKLAFFQELGRMLQPDNRITSSGDLPVSSVDPFEKLRTAHTQFTGQIDNCKFGILKYASQ